MGKEIIVKNPNLLDLEKYLLYQNSGLATFTSKCCKATKLQRYVGYESFGEPLYLGSLT